ncbi:MAG: hypothetical protein ACKO34_06125 [Vampirovibrionales bacterium]
MQPAFNPSLHARMGFCRVFYRNRELVKSGKGAVVLACHWMR